MLLGWLYHIHHHEHEWNTWRFLFEYFDWRERNEISRNAYIPCIHHRWKIEIDKNITHQSLQKKKNSMNSVCKIPKLFITLLIFGFRFWFRKKLHMWNNLYVNLQVIIEHIAIFAKKKEDWKQDIIARSWGRKKYEFLLNEKKALLTPERIAWQIVNSDTGTQWIKIEKIWKRNYLHVMIWTLFCFLLFLFTLIFRNLQFCCTIFFCVLKFGRIVAALF